MDETESGGLARFAEAVLGTLDRGWIRATLIGGAVCFLFLTGVLGLGRPGAGLLGGGFDFDYLYYAGRLWLQGKSPYVVADYHLAYPSASGFAYPPLVAPLCLLVGIFPHDAAELLMQALNLASALFIVWGVVELSHPLDAQRRGRLLAATALVVLSSPFTSHVTWMGQSSLFGTALVVGAFVASEREKPALAGALSALALAKPQLSLLPVLWLAAKRDKRFLASLVLVVVAVMIWPLVAAGVTGLPRQYLESVGAYQKSEFQAIGFRHMFGLKSVGASFGVTLPTPGPLAFIFGGVLYTQRRRLRSGADVLGLLFGISLLFLFAHDYDLIALAPMFPAFYLATRHNPRLGLALLLGLGGLYFPQRFLLPFELPWLLRYRELLCFGYLAILTALNLRRARAAERDGTAALPGLPGAA